MSQNEIKSKLQNKVVIRTRQSALFYQRLVAFTVNQKILTNHGGESGSAQSGSRSAVGCSFPICLGLLNPGCFRFPPGSDPGYLVFCSFSVKGNGRLTSGTEVSAASGEPAGAGWGRPSSPRLCADDARLGTCAGLSSAWSWPKDPLWALIPASVSCGSSAYLSIHQVIKCVSPRCS